jgi:hypothetical protein
MSPAIAFARGVDQHPPMPDFEYAWLEAPLAARLAFVSEIRDWRDMERWPAGRLFGGAGEYQWRTDSCGLLHVVLLLDDAPMPEVLEPPVGLVKVGDEALILWGEWVRPEKETEGNPDRGPAFYANEIPRIQNYPLVLDEDPPEDATVRLVVRTYRDYEGRRGEFMRCLRVELRESEHEDG